MRLMLCIAAVYLLAGASASGTLQVGPAELIIENGYEEDCIENGSGLCLASSTGESLGDKEIDSYQRISFVGLTFDRERTPVPESLWLLPDAALVVRPSDHSVDNPVDWFLIENVGRFEVPVPIIGPTLIFNETGQGFSFYNPGVPVYDPEPGTRTSWWGYGDESAENDLLDRDTIEPFQSVGNTTWDSRLQRFSRDPCFFVDEPFCEDTTVPVADAAIDATPNANVGLAFVAVGVADHPGAFDQDSAIADRAMPQDAPLSRNSVSLPEPTKLFSTGPTPFDPIRAPGTVAPPPLEPAAPLGPEGTYRPHGATEVPRSPPPSLPLATAAFAFTLAVIIAALYARIRSRDEALASARRTAIIAALEKDGPMTVSKLARMIGVDRTTVDYHAQVLSRTALVRLAKQKNLLVVALPEQIGDVEVEAPVPLRERLIAHLADLGGLATRRDLDLRLPDVPRRSRNHALRQLQQAGRIELVHGVGAPRVRIITESPSSA